MNHSVEKRDRQARGWTHFIMKIKFNFLSPGRSLFHAVCQYDGQRWDRPCVQRARPSWWLRVCQCADGYHHRKDAQQAKNNSGTSEAAHKLVDSFIDHYQNSNFWFYGITDTLINKTKTHGKCKCSITYIHSHTTDTRPAVPLNLIFVVGTACLQDGFVNTTTTSNNTL